MTENMALIDYPNGADFEFGILIQKKDIFIWTNYTLNEIFETLSQCKEGIGSRLHFLYCLQKIWKNITPISSNSKITYNL